MAGLPRGLRPGLILALIASGVGSGRPALAETGDADGVVTAYPLPTTAREAYSPIGEGFESPLDVREDLKGPKPYIGEREERRKAQREQRPPAATSVISPVSSPTFSSSAASSIRPSRFMRRKTRAPRSI